jgi:hypothetical protein
MTATTWEIATGILDYYDAKLGKSLRDMLMDISSKEFGDMTLFHSVDGHSSGDGTTITFLPKVEDEARAMITGLIPYLTFHAEGEEHSERIRKLFSPAACERAESCTWDIARSCVVSALDLAVDELDDSFRDADYIFEEMEMDLVAKSKTTQVHPSGQLDDDSVSTFGKKVVRKLPARKHPPVGNNPVTIIPAASTSRKATNITPEEVTPRPQKRKAQASVSSAITLESRVSGLETGMETMLAQNAMILQVLNNLSVSACQHRQLPNSLHPGHPSFHNTGAPTITPRAGGSNAAGQAG